MRASILSWVVVFSLPACGGTAGVGVSVDAGARSESHDAKPDTAATKASSSSQAKQVSPDAGTPDAATGPRVYVRINAIQPPGSAGTSQETPTDQRVGILGVTLLKEVGDASPLVAISLSSPIDTPYNAGSSTLIGSAPASALKAGTYTVVRVPVAYVNFTVAGTAHYAGASVPGTFNDVIALTTGTTLMGAARSRGWYSTTFAYDGHDVGSTGSDSEIAQPGPMSGIGLDLSQTVAAYVFPLTLVIPETITEDMEIVFTANTWQDFHWMDESTAGYTTGVFDVSTAGYEPVTQLGANSATVTLGPVTTP